MLDQWAIGILGVITVWLTQCKKLSWRRWACIFGFVAQPFWIYTTWHAGQTGLFVMAILYTLVWMQGIWNHWIKKEVKS